MSISDHDNLLRELDLQHADMREEQDLDLSGLLSGFVAAAVWLLLFAGLVLGGWTAWSINTEPASLLFDAVPSRSLPSWTLPSELCLRSTPTIRTLA